MLGCRVVTLKRPAGFSLIELVIVLAITGILAGMAVPRYANALARYRGEATASRVATDLGFVRDQARQLGKTVTVTFNVSAGTYTVSGVERLSHRAGDYAVDLNAEPYRAVITSANFGGAPKVSMDRYGTSSATGQVVIRSGDITKTIFLDATTGRVTIQ